MLQKTKKTFREMESVHVCNIRNKHSSRERKYLDNRHSITNTKDLTLKQMFDISARLMSEQNEISGLETIGWEDYSWKYLSLIGDEHVTSLSHTKVYVFSDSVLCLNEIFENHPIERCMVRMIGMVQLIYGLQKL